MPGPIDAREDHRRGDRPDGDHAGDARRDRRVGGVDDQGGAWLTSVGDAPEVEVRSMPQQAWSKKRERQYEHIKEGLERSGRTEETAEEIAARTVNKERARSGEARESSELSRTDISSSRRGGLRSHRGPRGRTRDQLYEEA